MIFHLKVVLLILFIIVLPHSGNAANGALVPPLLIAHAAGGVKGKTYTNSLEALEENYKKGHRVFEIDFSWTSDKHLVAIHDWEVSLHSLFVVPTNITVPSKNDFFALKSKYGLVQLGMEDVLDWADSKGDAYIVTDVKENNLLALTRIASYTKSAGNVIPQVYNYGEYYKARDLGYKDIILTLYRMNVVPSEVVTFATEQKPFAITMPIGAAKSGLALDLNEKGVTVYAHTINDQVTFDSLKGFGVFGVYTDFLYITQLTPPAKHPAE